MSKIIISLLIFVFATASFAGQQPRQSEKPYPIYLDRDHENTTLIPAIRRGLIRYTFMTDGRSPLVDLKFDFEVAMQVWLLSLGIMKPIRFQLMATDDEETDIIIHYGKKPYTKLSPRQTALFSKYLSGYLVVPIKSRYIPEIDINSKAILRRQKIHWFTLPEARNPRDKKPFTSRTLAYRILGNPSFLPTLPSMYDTREGRHELAYKTLTHELGHAFGLADLPPSDAQESIMADASKLNGPSKTDIVRVKRWLRQQGVSLKTLTCPL